MKRVEEVLMKRLKWLSEDAITQSSLPFDVTQTRLQLLGFLISADKGYPAPVEMLLETGGRRYRADPLGYLRQMVPENPYDMRDPDIAVAPGRQVQAGMVAYAVSAENIIVGPDWQVRRELKKLVQSGSLTPTAGMSILNHLQGQSRELLRSRAYAKGGLKAMRHVDVILRLKDDIRKADARNAESRRRATAGSRQPVAAAVPV